MHWMPLRGSTVLSFERRCSESDDLRSDVWHSRAALLGQHDRHRSAYRNIDDRLFLFSRVLLDCDICHYCCSSVEFKGD